ncbi:MAG: molybdopterin-dependent oxidoreductase [Gammaproteobacteria bacterium]|nr:molybdopterin-dependent oxidoreductase [Gammaproteobacteria bacterium]
MIAERTRPAVCTACGQQCGILVRLAGDRVVALDGDPEHPSSRGFICPKGAAAHELHYDPARVHEPLKRLGPRGGGRWQTISWEQALDEIAARIAELAARHGRETLAYGYGTLHGADWSIGERFMNLFGSPNGVGQDKICYAPAGLGEALTYGFGPTFYTYPVPGVTRCLTLWGMRPSASMPLLWMQIEQARHAGAKLVVIDPLATREAKRADLWLRPRPGTDGALALAMIEVLISRGHYDPAFVAARTEGFEALRDRVADFPPARVAGITGVPAADIVAAAEMIAANRPGIIHAGNGVCQSGSPATQTGRAIACLVALSGNLDVPGGHAIAGPPRDVIANGAAIAVGALDPVQRAKRLGGDRYPFIGAGHADVDAALARRWYGQQGVLAWMATAHEPALWRAIEHRDPYPVTALILQHHNPVGASPDLGAVRRALLSPNLELFVSHDLFLNATSSLADYVLPAAHWLEKPFFSTAFGVLGFAGDYAEAAQAPIAPEEAHRSDYDLWRDLGARLGQERDWPARAEEFWNDCLAPAGLTFDGLAARRGPAVGEAARDPHRPPDVPTVGYGTPSGCIEFRSRLMESWGLDPLPGWSPPALFAGAGADFPLVLTTGGRRLEGFHQHAPQQSPYRRRYPEPCVSLHPETARAAGIADGAWIAIETPIGAVRQRALVTDAVGPDVIHADRWWYPEGGCAPDDPYGVLAVNINVCTDGADASCDPVFGAWLLRGVPCRVRALPAGAAGPRPA